MTRRASLLLVCLAAVALAGGLAAGCGDSRVSVSVGGGGFVFTTASPLPQARRGVAYVTTLRTAGGDPPLRFFVAAGALPAGLSLDRDSGEISGTPTMAGEIADVRLLAEDDRGLQTDELYRLTVAKEIAITTASPLPAGQVGRSYRVLLQVQGGTAPYGWALVSGTLPTGLALNPQSGELLGVPLRQETRTFSLRVRDTANAAGQVEVTESFQLTIN